ncbi:MAG: ABC transporter permease [Sporolactobacillus sp.]
MPFFTMLRIQLKLLFRNRLALIMAILVPVALTFLFSLSGSVETLRLGVADQSHSSVSKRLIRDISAMPHVRVKRLSVAELREQVANQDVALGLVIPAGYERRLLEERQLKLDVLKLHSNAESAQLEPIIQSAVAGEQKLAHDARRLAGQLHLPVQSILKEFNNKRFSSKTYVIKNVTRGAAQEVAQQKTELFNGFLAMFVWFIVIQGLRTVVSERENGTLARMQSTPLRYGRFLTVKLVAVFGYAGFQIIVSLFIVPLLFRTGLGASLWQTAAVYGAYLIALIGLTLLIVPLLKSQQQFTMMATMLVVLTGLLGGSFFSVQDYAPPLIQKISQVMPESWAISALNSASSGQSVLAKVVLMLVVGTLSLFVATLYMSHASRQKKTIKE